MTSKPAAADAGGRLLTAAEVADLLALPVSWVREATRNQKLPHLKLGRYRRYQRDAILSWLDDQHGGPCPPTNPGNRANLPSHTRLSV